MRKYEIVEGYVCGTCTYYMQHYTNWGLGRFHALDYGHCRAAHRVKRCDTMHTCPFWKERPAPQPLEQR